VHQGRLDSGHHFLAKPFRRQDLAAKIRAVLDRVAGA
jgi:DNA-binding response OmpR family regulator